jgi:acetoin utilization protein AcuC
MSKPLVIAYSDQYLDWKLGAGNGSHPTNPVRAQLATQKLVAKFKDQALVIDPAPAATLDADKAALALVHSEEHIHAVLNNFVSSEWHGAKPEVASAGFAMFRGTVRLVENLMAGKIQVGFNPQGAKHHAKRDKASGFCVFNDMAYAALKLKEAGLRPLYLDWDIHAGDGTHHLLKDTDIPTLSIHNGAGYPNDSELQDPTKRGTRHTLHNKEQHSYNWNVVDGDGNDAFEWAMAEAAEVIDIYKPGVILLAAGADGHTGPNELGANNNYSYEGFRKAAQLVAELANNHSRGRVLIGGAGGYQPFDHTPEIWSIVVSEIYRLVEEADNASEITQEERDQARKLYGGNWFDYELEMMKSLGHL